MALILIVDDSSTARTAYKTLLERRGHRVELADDGFKALEFLRRTIPDLILLDLLMPGMAGYEVLKRIREELGIGKVPIVVVTSVNEDASRYMVLDHGADDYLVKPFSYNEFFRVIERYLRS